MSFRDIFACRMDIIIFIIGIIVSLILGLFGDWFWSLSLMIGVFTTIVYLRLIIRQVKRLRLSDVSQAKQAAVKGVFLRYLLVILVLVVSTRIRWINLYWVMGGLLLIPISSFISIFWIKGHE